MSSSGSPATDGGELEDLRVTVEAKGRAVVVAVAGEIDMLTAARFQQAITTQLDDRPPVLVVDLSKVEFMASAGMNALLAMNEAAGSTTQLRVVAGSVTLRPLKIAGLTEYLALFKSLDAALTDP